MIWPTKSVGSFPIDRTPRKGRNGLSARPGGRVDNERLLQEIAAYCRGVRLAESTFGRMAVNDGKFVNRLRSGGRVTTETVERVRSFIQANPKPRARRPAAAGSNGELPTPPEATLAAGVESQKNFRFFDNRQKYLLFVNTCSEKWVVAQRVAMELANIHPRPPAVRVFDAGVGDGTVLARVMRAMHHRFPAMPFYIVGKEISLEDVRLALERMPDRFFEHPATVLIMTNLYYSEAPWLAPNSITAATSMIWHEVNLLGNTAHEFEAQITALQPFLTQHWRAKASPTTGNPIYEKPVVLVIYRDDYRFLLDSVRPRRGATHADYDLVIASQPYRARASLEFKAGKVVAPPGVRSRAGRPAYRHSLLWPRSRSGDRAGSMAGRESLCRRPAQPVARHQERARQSGARPEFQCLCGRAFAVPLCHAYLADRDRRDDRHLDALRRLECGHLCGADRGPSALGSDQERHLSRCDEARLAEIRRPVVP
jgi:hypothetical protein